jgi:hypothetical protein
VVVPLDNPSINYNSFLNTAYDPVTNITLSSTSTNLSTLKAGGTINAPAMSGVCSDDDAANPDSDDPDCD